MIFSVPCAQQELNHEHFNNANCAITTSNFRHYSFLHQGLAFNERQRSPSTVDTVEQLKNKHSLGRHTGAFNPKHSA